MKRALVLTFLGIGLASAPVDAQRTTPASSHTHKTATVEFISPEYRISTTGIREEVQGRSATAPGLSIAQVDRKYIEKFLDNFALTTPARIALRDRLFDKLSSDRIVQQELIDDLRASIGNSISEEAAKVVTGALLAKLIDVPESDQTQVMSSISATARQDRLHTSANLFSFTDGRMTIRFTSGAAVSKADTLITGTTPADVAAQESFRDRTADMLVALADGGSFAGNFAYDFKQVPENSPRGVSLTGVFTAAKGGNLNASGRVAFGATGELKLFTRRQPGPDDPDTEGFWATIRGGSRFGADGIIAGNTNEKWLHFGQLILEAKLPKAKLPIGAVFTIVNKPFQDYAVGFQVFGIAGM